MFRVRNFMKLPVNIFGGMTSMSPNHMHLPWIYHHRNFVGDRSSLLQLIRNGNPINEQDPDGNSALSYAAYNSELECISKPMNQSVKKLIFFKIMKTLLICCCRWINCFWISLLNWLHVWLLFQLVDYAQLNDSEQ